MQLKMFTMLFLAHIFLLWVCVILLLGPRRALAASVGKMREEEGEKMMFMLCMLLVSFVSRFYQSVYNLQLYLNKTVVCNPS